MFNVHRIILGLQFPVSLTMKLLVADCKTNILSIWGTWFNARKIFLTIKNFPEICVEEKNWMTNVPEAHCFGSQHESHKWQVSLLAEAEESDLGQCVNLQILVDSLLGSLAVTFLGSQELHFLGHEAGHWDAFAEEDLLE
jgi:hypothetical protein